MRLALEGEPTHVDHLRDGIGRGEEHGLAAEVDERLLADVSLRLRRRQVAGAEHGLVERAGRGLDEHGLAAPVLDDLALAVPEEHLRRVAGGHRLAVRVRQDGLAIFRAGETEFAARRLDHGLTDPDVFVAEVDLGVPDALEREEREVHLEPDRSGDPGGVDRAEREHARRPVEAEALTFVEREDPLFAGDDDGHDTIGLQRDRSGRIDGIGHDSGTVEGERPAAHARVGLQLQETLAERQRRARGQGRCGPVEDHEVGQEHQVAAVVDLALTRLVEEQRAVEVEDGPAILVDRRLAAEVALQLAAGVKDRIAGEVQDGLADDVGLRRAEGILHGLPREQVEGLLATGVGDVVELELPQDGIEDRFEHGLATDVGACLQRVVDDDLDELAERGGNGAREDDARAAHAEIRALDERERRADHHARAAGEIAAQAERPARRGGDLELL